MGLRILHTEWSTILGGQEMRVLEEADGMMRRGHSVTIACRPGSMLLEKARERGIPVFVTRLNGMFDVLSILRLALYIRGSRPDVVHAHSSRDSWTAMLAANIAGNALAVKTRHHSAVLKPSWRNKTLFAKLSDVVVTTGEAIRRHVIERTGAAPERVVSIPTGIDLDRFDPDKSDGNAFRRELGVLRGTPLIGTVGMLRKGKGHVYFVEAAARVIKKFPEARFVIVGDTPPGHRGQSVSDEIADRIRDCGMDGKVIMTGFREDVPSVLAALDVFVLASILGEGVSQALSQAMAMKKPVVATNVGGIPEQVPDSKTGCLVEKADSAALAEAVVSLLSDPALAAKMGENARRLAVEKFSIESMLDKTEALYTRMLADRDRAADA